MVVAVWSVKGGVGVTSVAAMLAIGQVERAEDVLIVDLCGDIPALLGLDDPVGPGVADWCGLAEPDPDALARLEVDARPGLRYLPRGSGTLGLDHGPLLSVLASSRRHIIVDCGLIDTESAFAAGLVASVDRSLLVMRACYLNLRRAKQMEVVPTGVIVVKEPHRALGRIDIELVAGAPVIAEFAFDASVARSIDVGLMRSRLPRQLVRAMGRALRDAA